MTAILKPLLTINKQEENFSEYLDVVKHFKHLGVSTVPFGKKLVINFSYSAVNIQEKIDQFVNVTQNHFNNCELKSSIANNLLIKAKELL